MNLLRAAELKVGLLVLAVAGLIAYMSMQVSDDPNFFGRSQTPWFLLKDAGGLVKNSSVKTAGIPVGIIKEIKLQDGEARITLSLKPEVKMTVSASVAIRSQGILGDKYIDINPGKSDDPPLAPSGQILIVRDNGSLDSIITKVGDIADSLKETAKAVQEAVSEDGTRKHILGRIVMNIEKLTGDIAQITGDNKEKINDIIDQIDDITSNLDDVIGDKSPNGLQSRLKSAMKNIDEISAKINNGQGTIGKLVNDDETVEGLNNAIDGVNSFLDAATKLQTGIDFHSNYLGNIGGAKSEVGILLQPGLDRFYYLGIIDDPAGYVDKNSVTTTTQPGGQVQTVASKATYYNRTKFTALFGKTFYGLSIKGGLIENSGGFGFDYRFWHERLKATVEAYSLGSINLRAQLSFDVWKGIYLNVGAQDILNKNQVYSNYLGAGLFLTNDDIKTLLAKIPLGG